MSLPDGIHEFSGRTKPPSHHPDVVSELDTRDAILQSPDEVGFDRQRSALAPREHFSQVSLGPCMHVVHRRKRRLDWLDVTTCLLSNVFSVGFGETVRM